MSVIDRPIFVVGNIRSGTTIFYNLLAIHDDVCWFSNYSDRFHRIPALPVCHRVLDLPAIGPRMKRSIAANRRPRYPMPWPREGDEIYHHYAGFGADPDGHETSLTREMETRLRARILEHVRCTGKSRFLSKQTANNRRVRLLHQMFPDAFVIHVIRDGRAVANSTLRVPWWRDTHVWWLGKRVREWEAEGGEPALLAALHWKHNVEVVREQASRFGDRFREIRYEDVVVDTRGTIGETAAWCGLPSPSAFVPAALPDRNRQWRETLGDAAISAIENGVGDLLGELGY